MTSRAEAFRTLYETHYRSVLAYCTRRTRNEADAADVTAETFTIAWRRFDDIPHEHVLPWLYATARRTLANHYRAEKRRGALAHRLRTVAPLVVTPDPHHAVDDAADLAALARAVATLRERDLEILTLAVWEELPHRQIAASLGIAEATVAVRLHRARRRLARAHEKALATGEHPTGEGRRRGGGAS